MTRDSQEPNPVFSPGAGSAFANSVFMATLYNRTRKKKKNRLSVFLLTLKRNCSDIPYVLSSYKLSLGFTEEG